MPTQLLEPPKNTYQPGKHVKRFDLEKAKELRIQQGLTYRAIAAHFGLKDHTYIRKQLLPFELHDTEAYQKNRVQILRAKQMEIISAITPQKIQKAPLNLLALSYGILYDKERLELGKSTQNIDYSTLHKTGESIESRLAELRALEVDLTRSSDGVYEASTVTKSGKRDTQKG